ncbi:amidophosphoribosyltransferase, partial [Vibrio sp. 10N.222.49.C9]
PNVYGIDMPSANELIAHGREVDEISKLIGADGLMFQSLEDLVAAVGEGNPDIKTFETSVFSGQYVTGDVDQEYLDFLDSLRSDDAKTEQNIAQDLANLE